MKTTHTLLTIALSIITATCGTFAAEVTQAPITAVSFPDSLPLLSPSMLRGSVLRNNRGSISIYSPSEIAGNDVLSYVNVSGADADEVIQKLKKVVFKFKVASTIDRVSVWANLDTSDWQGVGGGGGEVTLIAVGVGKWIIDPATHFDLSTYESLPVFVGENTTSIRIIIRNPDGSYFFDYIDVYNGWAYIPVAYAGKQGNIILESRIGDFIFSQAYTLTGTTVTAQQITGGVNLALLNYKKVTDAGLAPGASVTAEIYPILPVGTTDANDAPVITVSLDVARTVLCHAGIVAPGPNLASPWQSPRRGWYRVGNETLPRVFNIVPGQFTPITLPAGSHTIGFDFDAFDRTPRPRWNEKG